MRIALRTFAAAVFAVPLVAAAQARMADADARYVSRDATGALATYDSVLASDPNSYEALWKAARSATDLGEFEADKSLQAAYFVRARDYARRAVVATPGDANGHFELARAVGRMALSTKLRDGTKSPTARERVRMAGEVRTETLTALKCDSLHPGALHILGVWNARVMRLTFFERMVTRTFLGGQVLGNATWADAQRNLERAVAVDTGRIVHRLDLGDVYKDTGKKDLARAQYEWILRAPVTDFNDPHYKRLATDALRGLK